MRTRRTRTRDTDEKHADETDEKDADETDEKNDSSVLREREP